jgi:hypothetical protein
LDFGWGEGRWILNDGFWIFDGERGRRRLMNDDWE